MTTRNSKHRRRVGVLSVALAVGALTLWPQVVLRADSSGPTSQKPSGEGRRQGTSQGTAAMDPIVINSDVGETFEPAPAGTVALRGADDVFTSFASLVGSDLTAPPKDVSVQLGWLTLPVGHVEPDYTSMAYTAKHQLVWSFSTPGCGASRGRNASKAATRGVAWLFLDVDTAEEIDYTCQLG